MSPSYNIYCDESCHLEKDRSPVMVLGSVICPLEKVSEVTERIKEIKKRHGLPPHQELKWTKVTPSKEALYRDLVDYFFDDDDLRFRALICQKNNLNHTRHGQTHDDWYYKMYFTLLKYLISDQNTYNIYIDIKDTRGGQKQAKLHEIICNSRYDFKRSLIQNIQQVRSHEVQILQLTDVLAGAISYYNRNLNSSSAKATLVQRIMERSRLDLSKSNYSTKLNLFHWQGQE